MDVCVWSGDSAFGLAAIEPAALEYITRFKFIKAADTDVIQKSNSIISPTGSFPTFRHSRTELTNLEDLINYMERKEFNIDLHLNIKQKCEVYVFEKYIKVNLDRCLKYAWWVDENNFNENTRPWFARRIGMPFNFYYPSQYQKKAEELIESIYDGCQKHDIYKSIYKTADECFKNLSSKLGNNLFFFGDNPCSLDAVMYSYLAPILRFPLKDPSITNHLKQHKNLVEYVERITETYFGNIEKEYREEKKKQAIKNAQNKSDTEFDYQTVVAIIIAATVMLGYAHSHGLLAKVLSDSSVEYIDMFDGDEDDN